MFSWFRSGLPPYQTALAMLGAKTGQTVLFLGGAQPGVTAEIARVTGLNGRTAVAERDPLLCQRVEAAAAEAGTLVEFVETGPTGLPETTEVHDLVAITTNWLELGSAGRADLVTGAFRLVRPGGRIIVVLASGSKPLVGKPAKVPHTLAREAESLLTASGSRAVRILAEVPGTTYVEGVRPRASAGT
ncbi:MAG TPA: class I SAM-dependent methyltransferase [Vicinamibacterales bacterium]|nr:class I SAM-dependent methyltransferase [Vicinamibacterales bacterium]